MELNPQLIALIGQGAVALFNIILLLVLISKRKNAVSDEETARLDTIIDSVMPATINSIKTLCEENGIIYNKHETIKKTKKLIKEQTNE